MGKRERWPKLKPCPFCGKQPMKEVYRPCGKEGPLFANLFCCRNIMITTRSREESAAQWNARSDNA